MPLLSRTYFSHVPLTVLHSYVAKPLHLFIGNQGVHWSTIKLRFVLSSWINPSIRVLSEPTPGLLDGYPVHDIVPGNLLSYYICQGNVEAGDKVCGQVEVLLAMAHALLLEAVVTH